MDYAFKICVLLLAAHVVKQKFSVPLELIVNHLLISYICYLVAEAVTILIGLSP